jgi:hypothetical protein
MALKFYSDQALTQEITSLTTQHANTGMAVERRIFLANDNAGFRYENVVIDPTDTASTDESNYISLAPDNAGSAGTYGAAGANLTMANISDSNVAKPFWVKITTPSVGTAQNKTDLQLKVLFREFAV